MGWYAGVDLGGTHLLAAVAGEDGTIRGRSERETPRASAGTAVTDALLDALAAACDGAGVAPASLDAVGVASLGPLDREAGAVVGPSNLSADRVALVEPLAGLADTDRVRLLNDCAAAALGEHAAGDDPAANLVYLTVSTGIGAGVVVDGRLLSGRDGNVAEVGHWVVDPAGRRECGCGRAGHWEAYCSGRHLPAYARDVREATGLATDLPLDDPDLQATAVLDAADDDPLAAEVTDRVADWNVRGVANLVHAYAPSVLAVGGGVARNSPGAVLDPLRERVPDAVITDPPTVRRPTCGDDAVLHGAVAAARRS